MEADRVRTTTEELGEQGLKKNRPLRKRAHGIYYHGHRGRKLFFNVMTLIVKTLIVTTLIVTAAET